MDMTDLEFAMNCAVEARRLDKRDRFLHEDHIIVLADEILRLRAELEKVCGKRAVDVLSLC